MHECARPVLTLFGLVPSNVWVLVVWERARDLCFCSSGDHDCCLSSCGGLALMTRLSPVSALTENVDHVEPCAVPREVIIF